MLYHPSSAEYENSNIKSTVQNRVNVPNLKEKDDPI